MPNNGRFWPWLPTTCCTEDRIRAEAATRPQTIRVTRKNRLHILSAIMPAGQRTRYSDCYRVVIGSALAGLSTRQARGACVDHRRSSATRARGMDDGGKSHEQVGMLHRTGDSRGLDERPSQVGLGPMRKAFEVLPCGLARALPIRRHKQGDLPA